MTQSPDVLAGENYVKEYWKQQTPVVVGSQTTTFDFKVHDEEYFVGSPTCGKLSKKYGRKTLYRILYLS